MAGTAVIETPFPEMPKEDGVAEKWDGRDLFVAPIEESQMERELR